MRTNPGQRQRVPAQQLVSGLRNIMGGIFGTARSPKEEFQEQASALQSVYHFHQGDLFLPGPPSFALDPSHETPLATVWGHAFLVRPNAFQPLPVGAVAYTGPIQPLVGVAGPIHGQLIFQPLSVRTADGG